MNSTKLTAALLCLAMASGVGARAFAADTPNTAPATQATTDPEAAVCEVARVATARTVAKLSQPEGIYLVPAYHIALPKTFDPVESRLKSAYASSLTDNLERTINRTAEQSMQPAGDFVLRSLQCVVFADSKPFVAGASDAITAAMRKQVRTALINAMRPVVHDNLAKAGAFDALERVRERYERLTNQPFIDFDIDDFALNSVVRVFFTSVADQEQDIRDQPSARPSDSIRQVFSKP